MNSGDSISNSGFSFQGKVVVSNPILETNWTLIPKSSISSSSSSLSTSSTTTTTTTKSPSKTLSKQGSKLSKSKSKSKIAIEDQDTEEEENPEPSTQHQEKISTQHQEKLSTQQPPKEQNLKASYMANPSSQPTLLLPTPATNKQQTNSDKQSNQPTLLFTNNQNENEHTPKSQHTEPMDEDEPDLILNKSSNNNPKKLLVSPMAPTPSQSQNNNGGAVSQSFPLNNEKYGAPHSPIVLNQFQESNGERANSNTSLKSSTSNANNLNSKKTSKQSIDEYLVTAVGEGLKSCKAGVEANFLLT